MFKELTTVKRLEEALEKAKKGLEAKRASRRILCCCGKKHAIKDLHLIKKHRYVEPYSCSGGDYYVEGEFNFVGPCGVRNRLLFDDYSVDWRERNKIGVAAKPTFKHLYRHLFKSSEDEYGDKSRVNNVNEYVDGHRKYFELPEKPKK